MKFLVNKTIIINAGKLVSQLFVHEADNVNYAGAGQ